MRRKRPVRGKPSLRFFLLLAGVFVLSWLAWTAQDELLRVVGSVVPVYFIGAVLVGAVFMVAQGQLFTILLAKHRNDSARPRDALAAFLASQPGKYVPGKVWQAVMQSLTLGRTNTIGAVAVANIELTLIGLVHMTALGLAALLIDSPAIAISALLGGVVLAARISTMKGTTLLSLLPTRLSLALRPAECSFDGERVSMPKALSTSVLLTVLSLVASLGVLVSAGDAVMASDYAGLLAVLYLGFAASFLVLMVPAGIGVREAATVALGAALIPDLSSQVLISVALLARCWQLATDAVCLGIGAFMLMISGRRSPAP